MVWYFQFAHRPHYYLFLHSHVIFKELQLTPTSFFNYLPTRHRNPLIIFLDLAPVSRFNGVMYVHMNEIERNPIGSFRYLSFIS